MKLNRRDFLKAAAATVAASELVTLDKVLAGHGDPPVIWLQGQGCTGCSVSLLNTVNLATIDEVLLNTINLEYHSTVMASAGELANVLMRVNQPSTNELDAMGNEWLSHGAGLNFDINGDGVVNLLDLALAKKRGYILVVEGAIPTGSAGKFCTVGPGLTMQNALRIFASRASAILAVGACAAYGGVSKGNPNPTGTLGVKDALTYLGLTKTVINIPGCPAHPDWVIGTISYMLVNGVAPPLDSNGRPTSYFGPTVHSQCQNLSSFNSNYSGRVNHGDGEACLACHTNTDSDVRNPRVLGGTGCLYALGCKGRVTHADCPVRKWNSPGKNLNGVSWCVQGRSPCYGCTEPNFPDGMSPFFELSGSGAEDD
jgi:hydrogenase small subunit